MSQPNTQRVIVVGYTGLIGSAIVEQLTSADRPKTYEILGVTNKTSPGMDLLMGQVHIALTALNHLPLGGSVTLTSGALSHSPIVGSAAVALANGAIDSFVKAVALEAPTGRRINAVSPGWIRETRIRMGLDPAQAVAATDVARLYTTSIESRLHGEVLSTVEGYS